MKRILIFVMIFGLMFGAISTAEAAKKKKKTKKVTREVEGSYDAPALVIAGGCAQTGAIGCVSIATGPTEAYITEATVTDAHGQPVFVSIQSDSNGDNQDDTVYGSFCGELTEPISIDPGAELHFWVGGPDPGWAGCPPAEGTSGTITATLSNLP